MRKVPRLYWIALGIIGLWGVFSYAYLGVEDGSSGLSPLGWIHSVFFLPGLFLFHTLKGTYSNADLPLAAVCSLGVYAVAVVLAIRGVGFLNRAVLKRRVGEHRSLQDRDR